jgi:hypothetical protein
MGECRRLTGRFTVKEAAEEQFGLAKLRLVYEGGPALLVSLNLARGASHEVGRDLARALNEAVTHITVEDYMP